MKTQTLSTVPARSATDLANINHVSKPVVAAISKFSLAFVAHAEQEGVPVIQVKSPSDSALRTLESAPFKNIGTTDLIELAEGVIKSLAQANSSCDSRSWTSTDVKNEIKDKMKESTTGWVAVHNAILKKSEGNFGADMRVAINNSIVNMAVEYAPQFEAMPTLLIGRSGNGKTAIAEAYARIQKARLYSVSGNPGLSPADIWGFRLQGQSLPGPATLACQNARQNWTDGKRIRTVFLADELARMSVDAQSGFLEFVRPRFEQDAASYGVPYKGDFFLGASPLWGEEHAPCSHLTIISALNPWGEEIDDALNRRFNKIFVKFDRDLLRPFSERMRKAITMTWDVAEGVSPDGDATSMIPLDYGLLGMAAHKDDTRILKRFRDNLQLKEFSAGIMAGKFDAEMDKLGIRLL